MYKLCKGLAVTHLSLASSPFGTCLSLKLSLSHTNVFSLRRRVLQGLLQECHSAKARYLFQQDKCYDVSYDTGDKSLQCGRRVSAMTSRTVPIRVTLVKVAMTHTITFLCTSYCYLMNSQSLCECSTAFNLATRVEVTLIVFYRVSDRRFQAVVDVEVERQRRLRAGHRQHHGARQVSS